MITDNIKNILKKQHYLIVGDHTAVQICRWTKKALRNEGVCYKEKFYGIKSHLCCQMTPAIMFCPNKCLHCWRAIELTLGNELKGKINSPLEIIDGCIKAQKKLLIGFKIDSNSKKKQLSKANMKKYLEAQEPMQFAISLSGEPTIYPYIGNLIEELHHRGKTSFLVTNGLYPKKIKEIAKKKQLPTQLYISVNAPNEIIYKKIHRSSMKNAWKKLNETLEFLPSIKSKTRTVFRMNLIRDLNMDDEHVEGYAKLIRIATPLFVEVKGYMAIGFARERLGYNRMPSYNEMKIFVEKLSKETRLKILDNHEYSRVWVLGEEKGRLKIRKGEI